MSHTAEFNGVVIASSDKVVDVDGYIYFPPESLKMEFFKETNHTTTCGWKGTCNYYTISAGGKSAENACWQYRNPKPTAKHIENYVGFYPVVKIK